MMGFTPAEVRAMTLWELHACLEGWRAAHGGEEAPQAPSSDEFEAMLARQAERDAATLH